MRQLWSKQTTNANLIDRMLLVQLEVENDLVRWTESFISERKVRLADHEVNTGMLPEITHPLHNRPVWPLIHGRQSPGRQGSILRRRRRKAGGLR